MRAGVPIATGPRADASPVGGSRCAHTRDRGDEAGHIAARRDGVGVSTGRATPTSGRRHPTSRGRRHPRARRVGGQRVRHGRQHSGVAAGGDLAQPSAAVGRPAILCGNASSDVGHASLTGLTERNRIGCGPPHASCRASLSVRVGRGPSGHRLGHGPHSGGGHGVIDDGRPMRLRRLGSPVERPATAQRLDH